MAGVATETARFMVTENNAVFTDDGRRVEPGSGEMGMVAVGGFLPVGYYKDEAKTAQTFRELEGRRWSVPGDFATVNADGTIHLLGRGSVCINTGGEKVFPEEVEEALKTHPSVRDAVVVGVPDPRFGETICGVVEPRRRRRRRRRGAQGARHRPARRLQGAAQRGRGRLDRPGGQRQGRLPAAQGARRGAGGSGAKG